MAEDSIFLDINSHKEYRSDAVISRRESCPVCHDLEHENFSDLDHTSRYTQSDFGTLLLSARSGGCQLCSIIFQGLVHFWGIDLESWEVEDSDTPSSVEGGDEEPDEDRQDTTISLSDEKENSGTVDAHETHGFGGREGGIDTRRFKGKSGRRPPKRLVLCSTTGKPLQVWRSQVDGWAKSDHYSTRLEFFTESGRTPDYPAFASAETVPPLLDLTRCKGLLQNWLQGCNALHKSRFEPAHKLPKRLLDITGDCPRLVETTGLDYSRYVTLSHCWGNTSDMIKTTKNNYTGRCSGINWVELPKIFRNAIAITRCIECRWLWIDSLCIVQDDDEDWQEESAKMGDIYSNSYLSIAATSSSNGHGNLFSKRSCLGGVTDDLLEWSAVPAVLVENLHGTVVSVLVRVARVQEHTYFTRRSPWASNKADT